MTVFSKPTFHTGFKQSVQEMSPAHRWVVVYLLLWIAAVCWFVAGEQLHSLSDDSVSYLIMGQYWSPWHDVPAAITDIYPYELYPPLFGWLLAVTDAAWYMPWAHALVVILLGMAWYACFHLTRRWLNNAWAALAVVVLLSLASYSLIHVQRILSENLYLLLTFAVLWVAQAPAAPSLSQWPSGDTLKSNAPQGVFDRQAILLATLLSLLVLTRSTGLVMVLAWFVQQFLQGLSNNDGVMHRHKHWLRIASIGLIPIIGWLMWSWLRPDVTSDRYSSDLVKGLLSFNFDHSLESFSLLFLPQLVAIRDAWYSVWMVYWIEDYNFSYLIVSLTGLLGGVGLLWRLRSNQLDAWYVLGTLLLLSLWPYPGQMIRFIYVIAPLWLMYGLFMIQALARLSKHDRIGTISVNGLALLMLLAVLPAVGHVVGRATFPETEWAYSEIAEFYLRLDPVDARQDARRQLEVFADMQRIRESTNEGDRVMWNTAGYIPLLAGRYGQYFPATEDRADFLQQIADSSTTHIYLSRFNPRRTTLDNNELKIYALLQAWTQPLWVRKHADGQPDSLLLKIDQSRLHVEIAKTTGKCSMFNTSTEIRP